MHLSLTKTITFALLGLGNVLPSAYGAPTELSRLRSAPRSGVPLAPEKLFSRALVPRKGGKGGGGDGTPGGGNNDTPGGADGPNPGGFGGGGSTGGGPNPGGFGGGNNNEGTLDIGGRPGYTYKKNTVGSEDSYTVESDGVSIGDIRVDREQKSITADDVNNADDPKGDSRARLNEVLTSVFTGPSGMKPGDLNSVHYENVSERSTAPAIQNAVDRKGEESFSLSKSASGDDKTLFDSLMATPLGRSTQTLLNNAPVGKQVTRIDVGPGAGGDEDFNLSFYLG